MGRVLLGFLVLALIFFSSCSAPEQPPSLSPEAVPEEAAQSPPIPPAADIPLPEEVKKEAVKTPEIDYPFLGSDDAPVTIVEYGDFSDRLSSNAAISQVSSLKRDYVVSNKVKLVFKPYPLSGSEDAKRASEAAWCMWEQGSVPFWAYQSTLFTFYTHLDDASLKNYASRVPNSDKAAFVECLDSGRYAAVVASTLDEGKNSGFSEVPVFVIGEKVFAGDVSYKTLKSAIDEELASAGADLITGNAVFSRISADGVHKKILGFLEAAFRKI